MNMLIGSGIGCPYRWLIKIRYVVTPLRVGQPRGGWGSEEGEKGRGHDWVGREQEREREKGELASLQRMDRSGSYFADKRDWNFDGNYSWYLQT